MKYFRPPSGIAVNLLSRNQTSAFVKLQTVIPEENKEAGIKTIGTYVSRKRKYNEELIDFHSSNDNFYGFKNTDISKSLISCNNLVTVFLKFDNNFFKRKFNEIADYRKKYTHECGCNDINQPIVFNESPNKIKKSIMHPNINTYKLGESEPDMSPILNKNSCQEALVDSSLSIENSNNQQNNLFRSSDHKILIYNDKHNQKRDISPLCNLSTIKVKHFYNSSFKNISTSKKPNKHTEILQNQIADPSVNKNINDTQSYIKLHPEINVTTNKVNNTKIVKSSPKKIKLSANITGNIQTIQFENVHNLDKKKIQEDSDFELAKKLQAEFDLIHIPSRTRRGTTRQITLDEMLLV